MLLFLFVFCCCWVVVCEFWVFLRGGGLVVVGGGGLLLLFLLFVCLDFIYLFIYMCIPISFQNRFIDIGQKQFPTLCALYISIAYLTNTRQNVR